MPPEMADGPVVVVLIHGLIGSFADPRTLSLLDPATLLAPELHGYGSAAAPPKPITINEQVAFVHDSIEAVAPGSHVQLVGHSVGGVIAATFAHRYPRQVASFVNVEGNFTLEDAFWSRRLASLPPQEVREMLESHRSDPAQWLRSQGAPATAELTERARELLDFQPAETLRQMARAVVEHTRGPEYEHMLRDVFAQIPVHLVTGARSRTDWHVPEWALDAAASYTEIPNAGHMVMLEAPDALGRALHGLLDLAVR